MVHLDLLFDDIVHHIEKELWQEHVAACPSESGTEREREMAGGTVGVPLVLHFCSNLTPAHGTSYLSLLFWKQPDSHAKRFVPS